MSEAHNEMGIIQELTHSTTESVEMVAALDVLVDPDPDLDRIRRRFRGC